MTPAAKRSIKRFEDGRFATMSSVVAYAVQASTLHRQSNTRKELIMTRRVSLGGQLHVVDDEIRKPDEFDDSFFVRKYVTTGEWTPIFGYTESKYEFRCGGEIRVEIELKALERPNKNVEFNGMLYLYEGITENTRDLDGMIPLMPFTVQPDVETVKTFTVKSWEDKSSAQLHLTVTNVPSV